MDLEPTEVSQERAVSSEPCLSRPKPFDDTERSARKRQRLSSGSRSRSRSRSRSADTSRASVSTTYEMPSEDNSTVVHIDIDPARPQTPSRTISNKIIPEPTSSKVTINLRSSKVFNGRTSPRSLSPTTPSKMSSPSQMARLDIDQKVESTAAPSETLSSSSSTLGSPTVELVMEEDDVVEYSGSPPVAIIDDDELLLEGDPVLEFPYHSRAESLTTTLRKIIHFFEYEPVDNDDMFCRLRDWIESYLQITQSSEWSWHESYEKHTEFWDKLPDIVGALSRRRNFFGNFLQRSRDGRQALLDFFLQFAALTARFVAMDVRTLIKNDDEGSESQPVLASRPYLLAFGWLIQKREGSIGQNLEIHYRFDWNEEAIVLVKHFIESGANIPTLVRLVRGHLALMTKTPKAIEDLTEPCRIVEKAISQCLSFYDTDAPRLIKQGYRFYQALAPALDLIIEKHATSLTTEAALTHIMGLAKIYQTALNIDPSPAEEIIVQYSQSYPRLPVKSLGTVISMEWKFGMLKKLIVCGQMQLRVSGVTNMCSELLNMYQKYKRDDATRQPILIHFAHYIMSNKLVDYIVGTGSHPELISESGNIVGFLVVTKAYTNKETDTIWQTVTTSQDPRVVEAILRMLSSVLNLLDTEKLLYLCDKARALPIEAFTPAMRDHCQRIFNQLLEKTASSEGIQSLTAPPYELCVRLIRESSVPRPEAPLGLLEIQHWATRCLRELVVQGPESEVRNSIYLSCIKDISSRSSTASGSICALFGLLCPNLATDLHILTTNHGLTRLMVEEVEYTNKSTDPNPVPANVNSPARQARRDLLLAIILQEPRTLTSDLGKRLWDSFVGKDARGFAERETAWQILNSAATKASSRNTFIDTCFKEYLPTLEPQCYSIGSLDFTREAIQAWLREAQGDLLDEDQASRSHGLEQLWRMILTAPPNTIEDPAINMLVEIYVDSPIIQSMAKPRAHAVHLKLVNRCLEQLSYAAGKLQGSSDDNASGDDESMVIVTPEEHVGEEELIFTRSLVLLREFLRSYQSKPHFVIQKLRPAMDTTHSTEVKGAVQVFKYQTFDGKEHGVVGSLDVGSLNTVPELFAIIEKITGFKNFKLYHWGVELSLNTTDQNASIKDLQIGKGLVLVAKQDGEQSQDGIPSMRSTSLEAEIINHFDAFWDYLGMEERLSKEIYHFLVKFPVYPKLLAEFDDDSAAWTDIFPLKQPFKCLYVVYALRENLKSRMRDGVPDGKMLARSLSLIVSAITNEEVLGSCENEDLRSLLAQTLVDCLIQLLREPLPADALATCLTTRLLECLLKLLETSRLSTAAKNSVQMVSATLEAILEASLRSQPFWAAFISSPDMPQLLRELLLEDPRSSLRRSVMKQITSKCTFAPSLSTLSTLDIAAAFWPLVYDLILPAVSCPDKCEETLSVALLVFRHLAEASVNSVDLNACLSQWGSLLVEHTSQETIGYLDDIDVVSRGLSNLLYWCTSFSKASEHSIAPNELGIQLFTKHLFPELSDTEDERLIPESTPVLNTITRRYLSDAIVNLTRDDLGQYKEIMGLMEELAPYDQREENPYALDLPFGFDRSKYIRSSTGYVGLRNLSNTCYLNSLFTQLFMNVSFRSFMLNVRLVDTVSSQKLLHETQKLFGFMQNSFRRFVDPSSLALSIRTYDDTNIDVNIQMDVDEFYNLLFDRWEGQMQSPADKRKFRSFYGGQLVQQVKSKECSHISERLEPFSAIQCDIKGKSSLQESLQAYVDGEVMEGDNKYKCSTCDRHVNAVKRACLQDIPDNLIFHLKRFDFNLRTMQRSKINDYFSFPHRIDMRPYKVEHLMDPAEDIPNDVFELVGILVHSGTAESGHYYSYVRERPSYGKYPTWVEFNDDHVTSFDPTTIEANCFGGLDYRSPESGTFQFDKTWSAYMLFYQRSSVLQAQQQELMASKSLRTLRVSMPLRLNNFITGENESLIRKYCLYDESHAKFVLRMLDNDRHLGRGRCSESHGLERLALSTTMFHLDQVVARTKDLPDFTTYMLAISHRLKSCTDCCKDYLEWFIQHWEAFRQLLMRNPEQMVRSEIALTVVTALNKVKQNAASDYGLSGYSSAVEDDAEVFENPSLFPRMIDTFLKLWDSFHLCVRAWPEYFGLLIRIARLGVFEVAALLDAGFLIKVLEILTADSALPPHPQYTRMLSIMAKRPVAKPVSLESIIGLLEVLLKSCDLTAQRISEMDNRIDILLEGDILQLNRAEYNLLIQHWTRGNVNILVEKLLNYNQNPRSTQSIIAMMLENFDDTYASIFNAIRHGIRKTSNLTPSAPFITAALTYCRMAESVESIEKMVHHVSNITAGIEHNESRENLRFFRELIGVSSENTHVDPGAFYRFVLEQIPVWAPRLLTYYDPVVRSETEDYIQFTLFQDTPESDTGLSDDTQANAQAIISTVRLLGISCLRYLHTQHVRPRAQAVRATVTGILNVIDLCKPFFDESSEDDEDVSFRELFINVIPQLRKLMIDEPEDDISEEWDNSDDAFSSSEALDPINDLVGAVGSDMNDADVQL